MRPNTCLGEGGGGGGGRGDGQGAERDSQGRETEPAAFGSKSNALRTANEASWHFLAPHTRARASSHTASLTRLWAPRVLSVEEDLLRVARLDQRLHPALLVPSLGVLFTRELVVLRLLCALCDLPEDELAVCGRHRVLRRGHLLCHIVRDRDSPLDRELQRLLVSAGGKPV